jgi:hypothetical protein
MPMPWFVKSPMRSVLPSIVPGKAPATALAIFTFGGDGHRDDVVLQPVKMVRCNTLHVIFREVERSFDTVIAVPFHFPTNSEPPLARANDADCGGIERMPGLGLGTKTKTKEICTARPRVAICGTVSIRRHARRDNYDSAQNSLRRAGTPMPSGGIFLWQK